MLRVLEGKKLLSTWYSLEEGQIALETPLQIEIQLWESEELDRKQTPYEVQVMFGSRIFSLALFQKVDDAKKEYRRLLRALKEKKVQLVMYPDTNYIFARYL